MATISISLRMDTLTNTVFSAVQAMCALIFLTISSFHWFEVLEKNERLKDMFDIISKHDEDSKEEQTVLYLVVGILLLSAAIFGFIRLKTKHVFLNLISDLLSSISIVILVTGFTVYCGNPGKINFISVIFVLSIVSSFLSVALNVLKHFPNEDVVIIKKTQNIDGNRFIRLSRMHSESTINIV